MCHDRGFQLYDEPSQGNFAGLANWSAQIKSLRPDKLRFINLFGAAARQFKTLDDYEKYVADFVQTVQPQLLSMDFYPFFPEGGVAAAPPFDSPCPASNQGECLNSKDKYGATLGVLRRQALKAGIPFWNFFNAMPFASHHYDPTEAQLRWQAMTSLAYGASGVMYFCYWVSMSAVKKAIGKVVGKGYSSP